MSRTNRRRAARAVAPVAGLLAAGLLVWQGSYAAFSASTDNTANTWTAGTLTLQNNGGTNVFDFTTDGIINATDIKPGDGDTLCLTVDSGGSAGGDLAVYRGALTNTGGPVVGGNDVGLSDKIEVTIDAAVIGATESVEASCAAGGGAIAFPAASTTVVNAATLAAMPTDYATVAAGDRVAVAADARVAYRISWTFVDGTPATDNPYQGASSVADLVWEIQ